jgi:pyoverdine/dityrosine biosynthesis protein Dit1
MFAATRASHERSERVARAPGHPSLPADILAIVMQYRRVAATSGACGNAECPMCSVRHVDKIAAAVARGEPVVLVLPAFPGKSPNPAKVLGPRPDMAERQSLAFLSALCRRIGAVYPPGARIVLCSDGRVFNDVVGIPDDDITTYQDDLAELIAELGAEALTTFNLDDVFAGLGFDAMRSRLMAEFAAPIEALQAEVRAGGDALLLYRGITRFLVEDAKRPGLAISNTALQKECKARAYQVIQRSRAWDGVIARFFPAAVRLSIHPQPCGSRKIGLHLMETADAWLTPWHCVAVEVEGRFRLMKRRDVERLGAELVFRDGRPSHYVARSLPSEA